MYIQDLHCNPEVQKNIFNIVRLIDTLHGVNKIYVEGAPVGNVDTSLLGSIPDKELKNKTIDILLNKGLLTGAEYYALKSNKEKLYGLEAWSVYSNNLERYRKLSADAGLRKDVCGNLCAAVEALEEKYCTRQMKRISDVFNNVSGHRRYLRMEKLGAKNHVALAGLPNLSGYIHMLKLHNTIKEQKVNAELAQMMREVQRIVPMNVYMRLIETMGKTDTRDEYFQQLSGIARTFIPDAMKRYPHLSRYFEYMEINSEVNPRALLEEEKTYSDRLLAASAHGPHDLDVIFLSRMAKSFNNFVELNMSAGDYEYFNEHRDAFKTLLREYVSPADAAPVLSLLDNAEYDQFYAINIKRNGQFLKAIANAPDNVSASPRGPVPWHDDSGVAAEGYDGILKRIGQFRDIDIVIAGGFHTGIEKLLDEQGVAHLTITPAVTQKYDEDAYVQIMTGTINLHKIFSPQTSALAAVLTSLGIDPAHNRAVIGAIITAGMQSPEKVLQVLTAWQKRLNNQALKQLHIAYDGSQKLWIVSLAGQQVFSMQGDDGKTAVAQTDSNDKDSGPSNIGKFQGAWESLSDTLKAIEDRVAQLLVAGGWHDETAAAGLRSQQVDEVWNAVGNGYIGWRASLQALLGISAEGEKEKSIPAFYVAGIYNKLQGVGQTSELVNLPNWMGLAIMVQEKDGTWVDVSKGKVLSVTRKLDPAGSISELRIALQSGSGAKTEIAVEQFASHADRHAAGVRYTITPLNYSAKARVTSIIDATMTNNGKKHFEVTAAGTEGSISYMTVTTNNSGLQVTEAVRFNAGTPLMSTPQGQEAIIHLARKRGYGVSITLNVFSSYDVPREAVQKTAMEAAQTAMPFEDLERAHQAASRLNAAKSDMQIKGRDRKITWLLGQLRLKLYHLWAIGLNANGKAQTIAAKGLSNQPGDGYNGHGFWDTDIYILPFLTALSPENAREWLMSRLYAIPKAKEKASRAGYEGTAYPWESSRPEDGEQCPEKGMLGSFVITIPNGRREQHITADIAYAVWQYWQMTGDTEFLEKYGIQILAETAKFWVSRVDNLGNGKFGYLGVIGPNEDHEQSIKDGKVHDGVDNNMYTNVMAKYNILKAIKAMEMLDAVLPPADFLARTNFNTVDSYRAWAVRARHVADNIFINFHADSGLFEQHDSFFSLRDPLEGIDCSRPGSQNAFGKVNGNGRFEFWSPLMRQYIKEHPQQFDRMHGYQTQVTKQGDTLQALFMLWLSGDLNMLFPDKKTAREIEAILKANYEYYEPRTCHGSNLSPGLHAAFAARVGDMPRAWELLALSASREIGSGAAMGIQAGSLGGLWQAIVYGFGGVRIIDGCMEINPHLDPSWRALSFKIRYHGTLVKIDISKKNVKVTALDMVQEPLHVSIAGHAVTLTAGSRSAAVSLHTKSLIVRMFAELRAAGKSLQRACTPAVVAAGAGGDEAVTQDGSVIEDSVRRAAQPDSEAVKMLLSAA